MTAAYIYGVLIIVFIKSLSEDLLNTAHFDLMIPHPPTRLYSREHCQFRQMTHITRKQTLRWSFGENPMKSAYLVAQWYSNFQKLVWMAILYREVYDGYPYHFLEICIPLCNEPIGFSPKPHLKVFVVVIPKEVAAPILLLV